MRVYKYRGGNFKRDLESLVNDEFYAPTKDKLNDPCEGFISIDILMNQIEEIIKEYPHVLDKMDNVKDKLNDLLSHSNTSGIYSLSINYLDELLWAHYSDSHNGFCVEYDLDLLLKFHKETVFKADDLLCFDVKYKSQPYNLTTNDMDNLSDKTNFMKQMLGIKSKKWTYEEEFRIVSIQSGHIKYDYRAVKSIHFGLRMDDEQKNEMMMKLQGRGIKYYQIKLEDNSYDFYEMPIEDSYKTDKKYLYSIAPIQYYAMPFDFTPEKIKYKEYYNKVAEIVRREPYCYSVEYIDIEEEKGTLKEPVFLVQSLKQDSTKMNQNYTLKDIDRLYDEINDLGLGI